VPNASELETYLRSHCPLSVAEYMRHCVAQYYASHDPFGSSGDFTTAPEISQIFGELVGAWLAQMWQQSGAPKAALLCELGPGRGTLMQDALRATRKVAGFQDALRIVMVENSPLLRSMQQERLKDSHPRITWQESLEGLPALPLFLIANEFFDALPIHQYVAGAGGQQERMVIAATQGFAWSPEGQVIRETSPESQAIVARIARHIAAHRGAALIIDYGYAVESHSDTLQALCKHQFTPPLESPGDSDITAHVDFRTLMQTVNTGGACAWGVETQGTFFKRLGAQWRAQALCRNQPIEKQQSILSGLERLVAPHHMGELFKVMAITSLSDRWALDKPPGF
jgi:NADH dehydrogenase [ubiquinone] 1 alpha subcomplex assembly factor 7